ncbi:hypothetical protein N656DRAFT_775127 [Canariomyces notabilis]|uniref:Uncharacterized protein n=1 Tax=Canariomyces notabilis TaxID=2074819 RepID=A0AAN6YXU8_9PEZI|nr:hypothetical protein N656DRAFT_775127 [Canariomyces arenarius]
MGARKPGTHLGSLPPLFFVARKAQRASRYSRGLLASCFAGSRCAPDSMLQKGTVGKRDPLALLVWERLIDWRLPNVGYRGEMPTDPLFLTDLGDVSILGADLLG